MVVVMVTLTVVMNDTADPDDDSDNDCGDNRDDRYCRCYVHMLHMLF